MIANPYLDHSWQTGVTERDNREIWEWAQDGELPPVYAVSGKLDIDTAPMIKQPLRDLKNPIVRHVVCMSGVQCLKTLLGELWLLWLVENDPGPTQWLQPTDQEAEEHAEERFTPLIEAFPRINRFYTPNRHHRKKNFIRFVHMYLRMEGAESKSNVQRKSIKNQMRSEVWQKEYWIPGRLKEADSRLTQFVHNSKAYTESQPGFDADMQVDDMHATYLTGNQNQWCFPCLSCGKMQPYFWSYVRADNTRAGLRWTQSPATMRETNSTDPNLIFRWSELKASIRYECIYCGHPHADDPITRRRMGAGGEHLAQNGGADAATTSYNWGQLAMPQLSWFETKIGGVKNFLLASAAFKQGNEKPLIDFFMKVAAEPYNPRKHGAFRKPETILISTDPEKEDVLEHGGFQFPHRCMTVDVQAEEFWVLVMAFSKEGHILIVWFGNVPRWQDVEDAQKRFKIPSRNVGIDISHRTTEVIRECCRHGEIYGKADQKLFETWIAFRGSDLPHFRWKNPKKSTPQSPVYEVLPYSWPPEWGDPCKGLNASDPLRKELGGKRCPIVDWSNPTIKDEAQARFRKKAEGVIDLVLRGDWNDEYSRQRDSQTKVMADSKYARAAPWKYVKRHKDDHGNDCYCMGLTLAKMRQWLFAPNAPNSESEIQTEEKC